jgi:acyl-CoA synthetase (AMP-forming)/AMP-acid ligase II
LLEAYYGVLEAGAVLLPLNIRLAPHELAYILNDAGATVLFLDQAFVPLVDSFRKNTPTVRSFFLLNGTPRASWLSPKNYEDLLASAQPYFADIMQFDENALAELFYTSGTSASPKGVMLTHRNVYLHALDVAVGFGVLPEDVHLHTIPLFHANGWGAAHFITVIGGKHVMIRGFDPLEVLRLIAQERVQSCFVVPIMAQGLIHAPQRHKRDLRDEQDDPEREGRAVDMHQEIRKRSPKHSSQKIRARKSYQNDNQRHRCHAGKEQIIGAHFQARARRCGRRSGSCGPPSRPVGSRGNRRSGSACRTPCS